MKPSLPALTSLISYHLTSMLIACVNILTLSVCPGSWSPSLFGLQSSVSIAPSYLTLWQYMGPCGPHCELKVRHCWDGIHLASLNRHRRTPGKSLAPIQPSRKKDTKPFFLMLNTFQFYEFYQIHWVQKSRTAYAVDSL